MNKEEMKNRISMALKDPILQQGFEIICKENALLKSRNEGFEQQIMGLLIKYEEVYKRFPDLKSAMDKAKAILKENEELKKENTELKENYKKRGDIIISLERQLRLNIHSDNLIKAKELLKQWVQYGHVNELLEQATLSFINSEVEK